MMRFRIARDAIVSVLGEKAKGRFVTLGRQSKGQAADEVEDRSRTVQVFFSRGEFPKKAGGLSGPVMHNLTFRLELTVAKAAKGDLAALNNVNSTQAELVAALENFQESADLADASFDELAEIVYQILMDARNYDLGLDPGEVVNRWIGSIEKEEPTPRGELVVVPGTLELTCAVSEDLLGDEGRTADAAGSVTAAIETHTPPDTTDADPAPAAVTEGS